MVTVLLVVALSVGLWQLVATIRGVFDPDAKLLPAIWHLVILVAGLAMAYGFALSLTTPDGGGYFVTGLALAGFTTVWQVMLDWIRAMTMAKQRSVPFATASVTGGANVKLRDA